MGGDASAPLIPRPPSHPQWVVREGGQLVGAGEKKNGQGQGKRRQAVERSHVVEKCYAEQGTWFARVLVTGALLDQASLAGFEHK